MFDCLNFIILWENYLSWRERDKAEREREGRERMGVRLKRAIKPKY